MSSDTKSAKTARKKFEAATKTLEKESLFFSALSNAETSARIVNRIVCLIPLYRLIDTDVPLYLQKKCSSLFLYNPERTAVVLGLLLDEITRCIRLSAYLCVKGIFPQAISVLRQAVELVGIYTNIWHEPQKADYVSDSDSPEYASAFRHTSDKTLQAQLKAKETQYRFMHCQNARLMTRLYSFLSSQFVHAASLNTIGLASDKDENLSCHFVDRVSPKDLEKQYQIVQTVLTLVYLEIFGCLPKDVLLHDDLAAISIATATLLPTLSNPQETLEPEMSHLVNDVMEAIRNLEIRGD